MTRKTRSGVGLLILTDVPKNGRVAVMQVRGKYNSEEKRPQYYAGGCQATVYGGIKKGESSRRALIRETREELGAAFAQIVKNLKLIKVSGFSRGNENGILYAARVPANVLKKIRLGQDSAGLRLIKPADLKAGVNLAKFKSGVKNKKLLAVFPDTKKAIRQAFRLFPPASKD